MTYFRVYVCKYNLHIKVGLYMRRYLLQYMYTILRNAFWTVLKMFLHDCHSTTQENPLHCLLRCCQRKFFPVLKIVITLNHFSIAFIQGDTLLLTIDQGFYYSAVLVDNNICISSQIS